ERSRDQTGDGRRGTGESGCAARDNLVHSRLLKLAHATEWREGRKKLARGSGERPREYSRSDEATRDIAYRCYLRGPHGVGALTPSGTWSEEKSSGAPPSRQPPAPSSVSELPATRWCRPARA